MNKKIRLLAVVLLFSLSTSYAYSPTTGLELGDEAKMSSTTVRTDTGEVIEKIDDLTVEISYESLIPGFVDGVLGMKVGEEKTFTVPPEKGYRSGPLEGVELKFTVKLFSIISPFQSSSTPQESSTTVVSSTTTEVVIKPIGDEFGLLVSFLALSFSGIMIINRRRN